MGAGKEIAKLCHHSINDYFEHILRTRVLNVEHEILWITEAGASVRTS